MYQEAVTNIVLLCAFFFFNLSYWIGQWSKTQNDSQGLLEWCFNADDRSCCKSSSDSDIYTQDWFHDFKRSITGAWFFIVLTLIIAPYCCLLQWHERKVYVLILLIVACFSSAVCLMVAVCVYGANYKSISRLKHHTLHSSFGLAVLCLLLYTFAGIGIIARIIEKKKLHKKCCGKAGICRRKKPNDNRPQGVAQPPTPQPPTPAVYQQPPAGNQPYAAGNQPNGTNLTKSKDRFYGRWLNQEGNLQVVPLDEKRDEYRYVTRDFQKNNEGFNIIQISRIQNKKLYEAHFDFEKTFMEDARKLHPHTYRKYLWHGTTKESTATIIDRGFNRAYGGKNACTFGFGVYFATEPSYSCRDGYSAMDADGAKYVFKCSVFVGLYAKGEQGMKDPPTDQNGVRYNSTVNNVDNPNQYVAFKDNQGYPQYLIKFEKKRF